MLTIAELKAGLLFCCQHILLLDTLVLKLCILGPVASGWNNRSACSVISALLDSSLLMQSAELYVRTVLYALYIIVARTEDD